MAQRGHRRRGQGPYRRRLPASSSDAAPGLVPKAAPRPEPDDPFFVHTRPDAGLPAPLAMMVRKVITIGVAVPLVGIAVLLQSGQKAAAGWVLAGLAVAGAFVVLVLRRARMREEQRNAERDQRRRERRARIDGGSRSRSTDA